jgi:HAD superfamily hydrolase (TIGR01549 family)
MFGIIFDSEGIVINTENIWDLVQKELLERRGLLYDRNRIKSKLAGKSEKDSILTLINYYNLSEELDSLVNERKEMFKERLESQLVFIKGFKTFYLKCCRNVPIALATSMKRNLLELVVKKLNLSDFFNYHIYSIDDVGIKSKPDPSIFLLAASNLGLLPSECIVIEDSPFGIIGAKNAGMLSIALTTTFSYEEIMDKCIPDYVYSSYNDLLLDFDNIKKLFKQNIND